MSGIFISYRREDSSGYAGRLYERLSRRFGRDRIFMDIATIEPGVDFVKDIEQACARKCCQSLQCSPNRVLAVGRPRPRGRWAT
ncbi:MAG TPA: TIR domain-containing protein [Anaerolineae bacterium]